MPHDKPSLGPGELLLVQQDPEEFNRHKSGLSVVDVDGVQVKETGPVLVLLLVASNNVLSGGCAQKVLLLQPVL